MDDIIEILANYGPMTASELASELDRGLIGIDRDLSSLIASGSVGRCEMASYEVLEMDKN